MDPSAVASDAGDAGASGTSHGPSLESDDELHGLSLSEAQAHVDALHELYASAGRSFGPGKDARSVWNRRGP